MIYTGSKDKTIKKWHLKNGKAKEKYSFEGHTSLISELINMDGNTIASGSKDKTIKIWDTKKGKCLASLEGHERSVMKIIYSKEVNKLFSNSLDETIRVWNLDNYSC